MIKATVVLTRYKESNSLATSCLNHLSKQNNVILGVLFLDQLQDKTIEDVCEKLSNKKIEFIYKEIPCVSLSFARNLGIKLAGTDIVLFTDLDAIPDENWAKYLIDSFNDKNVAIAGGKSTPKFIKKNSIIERAKSIHDVYSIFDVGNEKKFSSRIVGVNFAINVKRLVGGDFFNLTLGRRPGTLLSGEETELCRKALLCGKKILYDPRALVVHQIQPERMSFIWLIRRFYWQGYTRAKLGGRIEPYKKDNYSKNFYDYLLFALISPGYLLGYFMGTVKR